MIKGCQKKIIHLKNTDCPFFEEAYFILKDDLDDSVPSDDIIKEAQRIAMHRETRDCRKRKLPILKNAIPVLIGALSASLIFGTVLLFVAIFG